MNRCGVIVVVGALSVLCAPSAQAAETFRKGPYLQNVNRTSVTLMWEARRACDGEVRIDGGEGDGDGSGEGSGEGARVIAFTADEASSDEVYELRIGDLAPGHRYRYQVLCKSARDADTRHGEFATAPEPGMPFSFVVFGDSRSNAGMHSLMVERIRREVPDFMLSTGDLVDDGGKERQWQEFFDIEAALLAENTLFPALGNHDRQGRGRTADSFRKYFSLPENSPDPERYYAFTYGSARILVLDSNAYSFSLTDQTAWIERELQAARLDPRVEHIFVSMHHPPFSIALHGGQKELRERWTPLFEKYRVTAVFSGHDHVYSRAQHAGVRYFVSGGAGAPVYPRARRPSPIDVEAVEYFERVYHYVRVQVIGSFVEVSAVRSDGTLIETVSWGAPPRLPEPEPVASGSAPPGASDEPGVGGGAAGVAQALPAAGRGAAAVAERPSGAASARGGSLLSRAGGMGTLGMLGGLMMLFAGGVLVWTLRS